MAPHLVGGKLGRHVRLARKPQLVSTHPKRVSCLVQVEPIRSPDHRESAATRHMKHNRLCRLLSRHVRRSRLRHSRLAPSVFDHIEGHPVIAEVHLELREPRSRHRTSDYPPRGDGQLA